MEPGGEKRRDKWEDEEGGVDGAHHEFIRERDGIRRAGTLSQFWLHQSTMYLAKRIRSLVNHEDLPLSPMIA